MAQLLNDMRPRIEARYDYYKMSLDEVNIFGVRYPNGDNKDGWNDLLGIMTRKSIYAWIGTTDPGKNATEKKSNGAAHLMEGPQVNIWQVGMHALDNPGFAHLALVQTGAPALIWRDANRNYENDDNKLESGYFGINFHRAHADKLVRNIGDYSWGCQVTLDINDFELAMGLVLGSNAFKKDRLARFSYMIINAERLGLC